MHMPGVELAISLSQFSLMLYTHYTIEPPSQFVLYNMLVTIHIVAQ